MDPSTLAPNTYFTSKDIQAHLNQNVRSHLESGPSTSMKMAVNHGVPSE